MKKTMIAVAIVCATVIAGATSLFAATETHVVDFEYLAGDIGTNWSWNNTTGRSHSGMMPEGFFDQTSSENIELWPGYGYLQTVGTFNVSAASGDTSAKFSHQYQDWGGMLFWEGFGVSTVTDTTPMSHLNEMASLSGSGANGSEKAYAVAYSGGYISGDFAASVEIPTGASFVSMMINNTVYAYDSMMNGDGFAPTLASFAGGYLDLIIGGFDAAGNETGTFTKSLGRNNDGVVSIIGEWTEVDLSGNAFENAVKLTFGFDSNVDNGYGPVFPFYFAMDDLVYTTWQDDPIVPDPTDPPVDPNATATPEPATIFLGLFGMAGGLILRRRSKR